MKLNEDEIREIEKRIKEIQNDPVLLSRYDLEGDGRIIKKEMSRLRKMVELEVQTSKGRSLKLEKNVQKIEDGETIRDRYKITGVLGRGAQGEMLLALDQTTGGQVAIKKLSMATVSDWKAIELFERESKILSQLNHPAIPRYIETFHVEKESKQVEFYLVQEYVEGIGLEDAIRQGLRLTEKEVLQMMREILSILDYLHHMNPPVIHRDLKPSNLIRRPDGTFALVDFGAVQSVIRTSSSFSTVVGTSGYMPMEQLMGRAVPSSDLYSLAATVVHLLSGHHPADIPVERLQLQFHDLVTISEPLIEVLDKMLEPNVEQRYRSAKEVTKALQDLKKRKPYAEPVEMNEVADGKRESVIQAKYAVVSGIIFPLLFVGMIITLVINKGLGWMMFSAVFTALCVIFPIMVVYFWDDMGASFFSWKHLIIIAVLLIPTISFGSCGTRTMPFLEERMAPMVCPDGCDEIKAEPWNQVASGKNNINKATTCSGELGSYRVTLETAFCFMIFYVIYFYFYLIVSLLLKRISYFNRHSITAGVFTFNLFLLMVYGTLFNTSVAAIIARPMNQFFYSGHAISLVRAVRMHKVDRIRKLLADGGDIHALNEERVSALSAAKKTNDKEIIALFASQITGGSEPKKTLLDQGIIYDTESFFEEVEKNNFESVKLFLTAGFDINTLQEGGMTALAIAALRGHKDMVQLLLERRADVNKRGGARCAPITIASDQCYSEIVLMLVKSGADAETEDFENLTPLMLASKEQHYRNPSACLSTAKYLVENNAKINTQTPRGYTALLYAVENAVVETVFDRVKKRWVDRIQQDSYDLVKYLLEKGADPGLNIYTDGQTALRIAKSRRIPELIILLQTYHARE
jgi:ankyrin repeat protein